MPKMYESNPEPKLRQLTSDEIEVVSGGIIGGCVDVTYHTWFGVSYQLDGNGKICDVWKDGSPGHPS